jgi:hypothetical protein
MMDRRRFLLTSLAGVLAAPLAAEASVTYEAGRRFEDTIEVRRRG